MFDRFTEIDDLTRRQHSFLTAEDRCFYLGEYIKDSPYSESRTTSIIHNIKKKLDQKGRPGWHYKEKDISFVANEIARILGKNGLEHGAFVPVPPSYAKDNPLYDDRLIRLLQLAGRGTSMDVRELLILTETMQASHESQQRPNVQELYQRLKLNEELANPEPASIILFDDLLTTGAHFKAAKRKLLERFPTREVVGIFIARRVLPSPIDDFEENSTGEGS